MSVKVICMVTNQAFR